MRHAVAVGLFLAASLAGCGRAPTPPPPDVRRVTVEAPTVHGGRDLVVAGDWLLERLAGRERVTVGDVLVSEARALLVRRGYEVVPTGSADAAALAFDIERFDPELPQPSFVVVTVGARLTDTTTGGLLWSTRRERWMVPTRGAPTVPAAYAMAARTVAEELLAPFARH